ncbi:hypothetical protein Vadar_013451 [Vaccinium darrowii]|uniref:Uncharacterized protein n=1 Tax=Vaccinium darrowii TaxID=229202 RepID=A0ACB7Z3G9_9ERIC|nr:hypothetical protein Vadar_013451 [Vaccinium darrowii]
MAVLSIHTFTSTTSSRSSHLHHLHPSHFSLGFICRSRRRQGRNKTTRLFVQSSLSNRKVIKTNRRSPYGKPISPYDSDDDDDYFDDEDEEDDDDDWEDDELFSEDELEEKESSDAHRRRLKSKDPTSKSQGVKRKSGKEWAVRNRGSAYHTLNKSKDIGSFGAKGGGKLKIESSTRNRFRRLSEEIDLDEKSFALLDYLSTFGLKDSHFIRMYERHMPSLQINLSSARERVEFLLSVGVKHKDIIKILMRQPQILEYTVENKLKSHVAFLLSLGIPDSRIGQIITAAPSLFSYSLENSLKPTVRYLLEEVGIEKSDLSKVVQLSPQILVQRIDSSWTTRCSFLTKELGAPRESIVKMVRKHPQLLHYSIKDGLLPRIIFLRSIGMHNSDILKVLTSLTQVFSLSLEGNLKPKYMYLINELRNEWAGTTVDKYLAFRQNLLLKEFAKKYQPQMSVITLTAGTG